MAFTSIFFEGNSWQFSTSDTLIRLFPSSSGLTRPDDWILYGVRRAGGDSGGVVLGAAVSPTP